MADKELSDKRRQIVLDEYNRLSAINEKIDGRCYKVYNTNYCVAKAAAKAFYKFSYANTIIFGDRKPGQYRK